MLQLKEKAYYRTRDGMKAYVAAILENPFGGDNGRYPIVGYIQGKKQMRWAADGTVRGNGCDDFDDLVADWQEPVSKTFSLALYRLQNGTVTYGCFDDQFGVNQFVQRTHVTLLDSQEITLTERIQPPRTTRPTSEQDHVTNRHCQSPAHTSANE